MKSISELFEVDKAIIGMVHLPPLPGSVAYEGESMDSIIEFALRDAKLLQEGGVDGLIVENMWDLPYFVAENVPPEEIASMAVATREVIKESSVPVGVNIVHNGWKGELAIAVASGAKFIRVCLLAGALVWDTGEFDHGVCAKLLRMRKFLHADHVKLFADVTKKHAVMFPGIDLEKHAEWLDFYMADALIVTGRMTGKSPSVEKVRRVREFLPNKPLLVGSGVNPSNVRDFFKYADGAIVGTYFKVGGVTQNPVELDRVKRLMEEVKRIRRGE
ncbi:MAG: photosystem I assembly BtpA [Thermoproteota archaeon]|nr:MAG: photosystem I assembly BtpA [Candidatus Korarchaeota archaeon]